MSDASLTLPRSSTQGATRGRGLILDPVLIGIMLSILLLGLVMVTSASISIASHDGADPFSYVKAQGTLAVGGLLLAAILCALPTVGPAEVRDIRCWRSPACCCCWC